MKPYAQIVFALAIFVVLLFLDYSNLSIENNKWQYIVIFISALGIVAAYYVNKFSDKQRFAGLILLISFCVLWILFLLIDTIWGGSNVSWGQTVVFIIQSIIVIILSVYSIRRIKKKAHD